MWPSVSVQFIQFSLQTHPGLKKCFSLQRSITRLISITRSSGARLGKNTLYAKYVQRSTMIALRISVGIHHNIACAKLCASGLQNSWCTKEAQCMSLVKLAQKGQDNGQTSQKHQQIREVAKRSMDFSNLFKKDEQNFLSI